MKALFLSLVLVLGLGAAAMVGAQAAGSLTAQLDWTNPVDKTNGIQIEKASSATGTFTVIKQLPANSTTYTDATNGPGDSSFYRLAYFNSAGVGPYTAVVSKVFPTVPTQTPATVTVR